MTDFDQKILEAISGRLGHPAPFTDNELNSITYLKAYHAKDYSGLETLDNLRILVLAGCDKSELPAGEVIARLTTLWATDSSISDLSKIRNAHRMMIANLMRNFITDASPLLDCERLTQTDLTGNPLSPASYRDIVGEMRDRGIRATVSDEAEWEMTLRLHSAGLPYSYYKRGDLHLLSRPGLKGGKYPEAGHITIRPHDLRLLLEDRPEEISTLFDREDLMPGFIG